MQKLSEFSKRRNIELNADESIINQCNGLIYANCNKDIICHLHGEQTANKVLIYYYEKKESRKYLCPVCQYNVDRQAESREQIAKDKEEQDLEERFLKTGIGARYVTISFKDDFIVKLFDKEMVKKIIETINVLSNDYKDYIIEGVITETEQGQKSKCGKTLLIALLIKGILYGKKETKIKYITYAELNNVIKSKSESVINEYKKCDVLFIDDINCRYSDYSEQQFKDFLDYRYRNTLSTVAVIETVEYSNLILNKLDNAEIIKLGGKDD